MILIGGRSERGDDEVEGSESRGERYPYIDVMPLAGARDT